VEVVDAISDCSAGGSRDTVVVCFSDAAEGGDVMFDEEVLGEV